MGFEKRVTQHGDAACSDAGAAASNKGVHEAQTALKGNPMFGLSVRSTGGMTGDHIVVTPLANLQAASPENCAFSNNKVIKGPAEQPTRVATNQPPESPGVAKVKDDLAKKMAQNPDGVFKHPAA